MKILSPSLIKLVNILNDGQYHDGTSIGDTLKITRAAVWKIIKKLEVYGIKLNSIKGKGYTLLEPLILLNQRLIKQNLTDEKLSMQIFETIASTNDYLKTHFNSKTLQICLAEQQTMGKGRFNRQWHSPFGQNIYLSFHYPLHKDVSELAGLSLVIGLAIVKTLTTYHPQQPLQVKWPNDVTYNRKKIAGNIIEIQAETNGMCHAIIGVGINVNMLDEKDQPILQPWTSLRAITGEYIDRNPLCALLINNMVTYLTQFEQHGLPAFIEEWQVADGLLDREVTISSGNKKIQGKAKGIDQNGYLKLKLTDGNIQTFSSGDTSIIK